MTRKSQQPVDLDASARQAGLPPLCPVDRLPTIRRNRICLRIIYVGLLNFMLYTMLYAALGGDAHNGERRRIAAADGAVTYTYYVRGHFIRDPDGMEREVSRNWWIYSYLHSISVFITSAAMIISMLVLARPHILATMRDGWIRGQTFVFVFGAIVITITSLAVGLFAWDFAAQLAK